MYELCVLFLVFFIYSMAGYLVEVTSVSLETDEINFSRGFLIGPYIPVFGFGGIAMAYMLTDYKDDMFVLFIMGALLCTVLEYLTSLIMEKLFHLRWWDYSDKKFNINGRVCLQNSLLFGLAGILLVEVINPVLEKYISSLPIEVFYVIVIFTATVFFTDVIVSFLTVNKIKKNFEKFCFGDNTDAIKKEVEKSLQQMSFFQTRVYQSFPNVKSMGDPETFKKYKEFSRSVRKEIEKQKYNKKSK